MIVLAETNFVFELALSQGNFESCEALVQLAVNNQIELVLPAYSFVEPFETLVRRRKTRLNAHSTISREIQEISRSALFEERANQLAQLTGLLIDVGQVEQAHLDATVARLLSVSSVIDLSREVVASSVQIREDFGLTPQDAIVFASVLHALPQRQAPSCFVTRNWKDFSTPDVTDALDQYGCKLLFDFEDTLNFVQRGLAPPEPPAP